MPASAADPVSSVLKSAFASNAGVRNEIGRMHQSTGFIRGGSSNSVISSNGSLDHDPTPFKLNGSSKGQNGSLSSAGNSSLTNSPNLENELRANVKQSLLKSQQCKVEFDAPTRYVGGIGLSQATKLANVNSNAKQRYIILNPQQKHPQNNGDGLTTVKRSSADSNGKTESEGIPKPKVTFFNLSSVEVGYKITRRAGSGMFNVGNTCYLNSTLQALFHTPALYNYLINGAHASKCTGSLSANGFIQNCTICALTLTLKDTLRNNVIKPNRVYEKLKNICKHMVYGRQEDAHEFLRYLVEALQRSFLVSAQAPKSIDTASKETTPFNQIFGGYMRQDVTCLRCKHVSTTFQHFMDLLLDIRQISNIEEALTQYFRQERIGGNGDSEANMYKCEKCKVKVQAKKRYLIERPPAVLCIQLKRFSLLGGKISKLVQLSRRIDLAPYIQSTNTLSSRNTSINHGNMSVPQQSVNSTGCTYSLVAMITHVGPSPNCGHYTAIGEAANGQFFQFDDSSVRPISVGQALNTASYVVFYEMTKSSWKNITDPAGGAAGAKNPNAGNGSLPLPPKAKVPCTITSGSQCNPEGNINLPGKSTINISNKSNGTHTNGQNKPRIITLGSSMKPAANKLGIVSGAAKNAMVAAAASIVRTVTNVASGGSSTTYTNGTTKNSNKGGLVPYDDEDSSDSENTATATKYINGKTTKVNGLNTTRPVTASPFVPRSVTVNALKAKPSTAPTSKLDSNVNKDVKLQQPSVQTNSLHPAHSERKNSSSGIWMVTDADTHNPSVNSDNSTGSTSGSWIVKDLDTNKPAKSASTDAESLVTVQHSKTTSSWTVKPAISASSLTQASIKRSGSVSSATDKIASPKQKMNESMSDSESVAYQNGTVKSDQRVTSPSLSTSSSTSSTTSFQYKQKQYSSCSSFSGNSGDSSIKSAGGLGNDTPRKRCNGGNTDEGDTDYDAELDRGRTKKVKKTDVRNGIGQSSYSNGSSHNPFQVAQTNQYNKNENRKGDSTYNASNKSPWQQSRNKSWSSHRDHNYHQRQWQGVDGNTRLNHRDENRRNSFGSSDFKDRKYRNAGYGNDYHRGYNSSNHSYNNRDNEHRDYRDNRFFGKR